MRSLNRDMSCLSCKTMADGLYLPNSDEFYVKVEESKSGDIKGVYLYSNKVKKHIECIARLQEKTDSYHHRSYSGFDLLGFRIDNNYLYLYIFNHSQFVATGHKRFFRFNFDLFDANSSPVFNPELLADISEYNFNYDTCFQNFTNNLPFIRKC